MNKVIKNIGSPSESKFWMTCSGYLTIPYPEFTKEFKEAGERGKKAHEKAKNFIRDYFEEKNKGIYPNLDLLIKNQGLDNEEKYPGFKNYVSLIIDKAISSDNLYIEYELNTTIYSDKKDKNFYMKGIIDAIIKYPNKIIIVDYKTGFSSLEVTHESFNQLKIYAIQYIHLLRSTNIKAYEKIKSIELYISLRTNKIKKLILNKADLYIFAEKLIDKLTEKKEFKITSLCNSCLKFKNCPVAKKKAQEIIMEMKENKEIADKHNANYVLNTELFQYKSMINKLFDIIEEQIKLKIIEGGEVPNYYLKKGKQMKKWKKEFLSLLEQDKDLQQLYLKKEIKYLSPAQALQQKLPINDKEHYTYYYTTPQLKYRTKKDIEKDKKIKSIKIID